MSRATTALDTDLTNDTLDPVTNNPAGTLLTVPILPSTRRTDPEGGTITFSLGGADKDLFKLVDDLETCCCRHPTPIRRGCLQGARPSS